jgi:hypothetical protein
MVHLCCKRSPSLEAYGSKILDGNEAEVVEEDEEEEDDVSGLKAENCEVSVVHSWVGPVLDVINPEPIPSLAECNRVVNVLCQCYKAFYSCKLQLGILATVFVVYKFLEHV